MCPNPIFSPMPSHLCTPPHPVNLFLLPSCHTIPSHSCRSWSAHAIGLHGNVLSAGRLQGVASMASWQKLPSCPTEPASSKTDPLLAKAEPITNCGCASGIMYLRSRGKRTVVFSLFGIYGHQDSLFHPISLLLFFPYHHDTWTSQSLSLIYPNNAPVRLGRPVTLSHSTILMAQRQWMCPAQQSRNLSTAFPISSSPVPIESSCSHYSYCFINSFRFTALKNYVLWF